MENKDIEKKQEELLVLIYNSLESWIELRAEQHIQDGCSENEATTYAREEIVESIGYDFA